MKFYTDPLANPSGQAILLIRQFKDKELALEHVKWVLQHCVEKEVTRLFWFRVSGELKKY